MKTLEITDTPIRSLNTLLGRAREKSLVLLAQELSHWYVGEIAAAVNQTAMAHGYRLITLDFHRSPERERELLLAISQSQVPGCVFLWDHSPTNLDLYERIVAQRACIQLGDQKPIPNLDSIIGDDYSGAMVAVRHLLTLGYRQIGHLTLHSPMVAVKERQQAFLDALHQANVPINDNWILTLPYGMTDADRTRRAPEIRKFLTQPQLPRALFICADWLASETIECIQELGLMVPEDIALVGFDNALPYALTSIPLTTVHFDLRQTAQLGVERLIFRLQRSNQVIETCQILIPPTLIVRNSSVQIVPTSDRWNFVMQHLLDHFRENLSAQQVADMIGLDANYFSHQFQHMFGKRFTDYVNQLRLQYSRELLLTTHYTVEYIASVSGFTSVNHFYTLFKRLYRVSPHSYRKQQTFA